MASKGNIVGIVAWVLVVVLAIGAGALGFLQLRQTKAAAGLRAALVQVAATAGVTQLAPPEPAEPVAPAEGEAAPVADEPAAEPVELTADLLGDPGVVERVRQQVQAAIQGTQQELANTRDSLAAAQAEATGARAEVETLSQKVKEQTAAAETAAQNLAAKTEEIAAAKTEADKAVQEAQAAAEMQKAELEGNLASLKTRMEEEIARLQAELEAARQQLAAMVPAEAFPGEGAQGVADENVPAGVLPDVSQDQPMAEEEIGRVLGRSQMIALIRYSPGEQTLFLRLQDGQTMTYRDVPPDIYERLVADGTKVDMVYKFRIQGAFKSIPPDSTVVRKFWGWQRRHPTSGEVRVIEPELPLVIVDEEPMLDEATPAEEAAPGD